MRRAGGEDDLCHSRYSCGVAKLVRRSKSVNILENPLPIGSCAGSTRFLAGRPNTNAIPPTLWQIPKPQDQANIARDPMGSCSPQPMQEGRAAMSELTIWTYDWVPEGPRGFVRDLRLRWACEEAGLSYAVRTIPFDGRETNHLAHQPFGQVPFLKDEERGDIRKRRWTAASGPQERQADAARSGGRSGNSAMDDRRAQLDRDGHRTVVVSEDVRRRER